MAKPLLKVHCIEKCGCEYPVAIRVAMDDGTVQTYALENHEDLMFRKVMESVEKVKMTVGYQYKPTKRKSRIHRSQL